MTPIEGQFNIANVTQIFITAKYYSGKIPKFILNTVE